jgi:hypothetical protein
MSRSKLRSLRIHPFGNKALQLRLHGPVIGSDDVTGWFRLPCRCRDRLVEQVGQGQRMGRPNQFLLLLRKIAGGITDARMPGALSFIKRIDCHVL